VDNASALGSSQQAIDWEFDGFQRDDCCYHEFTSQCNIAYANFARSSVAPVVTVVEVTAATCKALERREEEKCPETDEVAAASVQKLLHSLGINAKQTTLVLPQAVDAATVVVLSQ
jgi:hypothetical protein